MTDALTLWDWGQRGLACGQVTRLRCWWAAVALKGGRARSLGCWLVGAQSSSYTATCCSSCSTTLRRFMCPRGGRPLQRRCMALWHGWVHGGDACQLAQCHLVVRVGGAVRVEWA